MKININVKIEGGVRTPTAVSACCTAVNEKFIKFANGQKISDTQLALWIEEQLTIVLNKMESA